jgi:hypothetical protein
MSSEDAVQGIKQRILHGYCVRLHMALIVTAVIASGVLSSKLLLVSGVHSLRVRYPIAVAVSYGVFLLLIRVWIWYVTLRRSVWAKSSTRTSSLDFGGITSPGGWGGGGSGGVRFGGGSSGGGGASDDWEGAGSPLPVPVAQASSGHGGFLSNLNFGGGGDDDDGWLVMLLLVALALAIFGAGGYLVYAAPQILPEAACQAILAPALLRVSKEHHHGWMGGVLRSTVLPFVIVCMLAGGLGWAAHRACPAAPRLIDVWSCPTTP